MGKYTYESNFDPRDNTEKITGVGSEGDEELLLGGEAKEISDEQYAILSSRYALQPEGFSQGSATPGPEAPIEAEKDEAAASETTPTTDPSGSTSGGRPKGRQS